VSLSGRANVGKSTLLNRLVGTKVSIVSPVAQTTRVVLRAVSRLPDCEIVFLDTPGIHKPEFRMNREMVQRARQVLSEVDLAALLIEGPEGFGPGDAYATELLKQSGTPAFLVINKIDAMPRNRLLPLIAQASERHAWEEIIPCSALTGEGCEVIVPAIARRLPPGAALFPEDFLSDLPQRLAVAELIREQVLLRTRQEVPHAAAVMVERLETTAKGEFRVEAALIVERDSQKGILIGRGGEMLKAIGQSARGEIATALGKGVHLFLQVKVRKRWRDDPAILKLLGIAGSE
jgi:GTP-binding protein Era